MSMIKRVYGWDGQYSTCYLTRIKLTPKTRWGQLYFHFFHRGDHDRDFHDHPYDFWTFSLVTYYEDVLDLSMGRSTRNAVERFQWHFRPAEYIHIQLGAARYRWAAEEMQTLDGPPKIINVFGGRTITLVWHKPTRRPWGFWVRNYEIAFEYIWIPWRDYLFS